MREIIKLATDFWELIAVILSGLGGVFAFLKKRKSSTSLLYQELERLKIQVIEQVQLDVKQAQQLAEKQQIINELKTRCPDCYEKFINSKKKGNE